MNYLIYNDDLSFEECFPETFSNLEDIESNNVLVIDEKLYSYLQNLTTDFKLKENFELKELYTIEDKDIQIKGIEKDVANIILKSLGGN
ncbi:MAG: hypothetical protein E6612_01510 [Paeniclostridium sordellii]|nr:hypothetical protein [Paeniclostridium sordellii]